MHTRTIAALTAAALSTAAHAQIHEGDIALGVNEGILTLGVATDGFGTITQEQCLFGVALGSQARTTDPGFDSDAGTFAAGTDLAYFMRAALRKWNGSDFTTIPDERVRISFGPAPGISTPLTDPAEPIEGVFVGTSGGEWHTHYAFRLELSGVPATGAGSFGVYLLELELRADSAAYAPSAPFWLVISQQAAQAEFDAAFAFAETNFGCPAPPVCRADTNGDGLVTPADFSAWIAAFNTQSPACDQNGDNTCSPADFSAWIANFNNGC